MRERGKLGEKKLGGERDVGEEKDRLRQKF